MQELFKIDKKFTPCLADDGDELFRNGIFVFNISRMIEYIQDETHTQIILSHRIGSELLKHCNLIKANPLV